MRMFDALEAINRRYENIEIRPIIEVPNNREGQIDEMKNYKRQYYLKNLNTYKQRNKKYREKMREEKDLENLFCNFEE